MSAAKLHKETLVKITGDVRRFAAEQKISEQKALRAGLEQKAKEVVEPCVRWQGCQRALTTAWSLLRLLLRDHMFRNRGLKNVAARGDSLHPMDSFIL